MLLVLLIDDTADAEVGGIFEFSHDKLFVHWLVSKMFRYGIDHPLWWQGQDFYQMAWWSDCGFNKVDKVSFLALYSLLVVVLCYLYLEWDCGCPCWIDCVDKDFCMFPKTLTDWLTGFPLLTVSCCVFWTVLSINCLSWTIALVSDFSCLAFSKYCWQCHYFGVFGSYFIFLGCTCDFLMISNWFL